MAGEKLRGCRDIKCTFSEARRKSNRFMMISLDKPYRNLDILSCINDLAVHLRQRIAAAKNSAYPFSEHNVLENGHVYLMRKK